jgi:L-ectoine synthase
MIVRSLRDLVGTARDMAWGNGQSRRFLLAEDRMGFSLTDTIVEAGTEALLEYKNHLEACYCVEGTGEVEDRLGQVHRLEPGIIYALEHHDAHWLRAETRLRLICVFNPPLRGQERHSLSPGAASHY